MSGYVVRGKSATSPEVICKHFCVITVAPCATRDSCFSIVVQLLYFPVPPEDARQNQVHRYLIFL